MFGRCALRLRPRIHFARKRGGLSRRRAAGSGPLVRRECLLDPNGQQILSIVRTAAGQQHPKLRELVHTNFFDYSDTEPQLTGYDACFFSRGVSSAGMDEAKYAPLTYDLTPAA